MDTARHRRARGAPQASQAGPALLRAPGLQPRKPAEMRKRPAFAFNLLLVVFSCADGINFLSLLSARKTTDGWFFVFFSLHFYFASQQNAGVSQRLLLRDRRRRRNPCDGETVASGTACPQLVQETPFPGGLTACWAQADRSSLQMFYDLLPNTGSGGDVPERAGPLGSDGAA